jgi:hypothetical protein
MRISELKFVFIGAINQGGLSNGGEEYENQLLFVKMNEIFDKKTIIDADELLRKPKVW